ncbi:ethionine resistance protein [Coemansia sp. RSA 2611]|nr:ethionine resistance protein [Coemansia sp. RSA 2611]
MTAQSSRSNAGPSPARRQSPQTTPLSGRRDEVTWQCYSSSPCPLAMHTPTPSAAHVQAGLLLGRRTPNALVSTVAADHQTRSMSPDVSDYSGVRAPRNMASNTHNAGTQVESYFSLAAPAEAAAGMCESTPSMLARSLSRRQSIALQSSCSYQMPLSLPGRSPIIPSTSPMRSLQQQRMQSLAQVPASSEPCWSLTSTKSLSGAAPVPRSTLANVRPLSLGHAADGQSASPQSDTRRRSVAHERYPPLTSIFESASDTRELFSEHNRAQMRTSTGVPTMYGTLNISGDLQLPLSRSATMPNADATAHTRLSRSSGNIADGNVRRLDPHPSPPIKRSGSSDSLASRFSTISSLASTSSAQSSYAYIFDSARPSAAGLSHTSKRSRHSNAPYYVSDALFGGGLFMFGSMAARSSSHVGRGGSAESSPLLGAESASAATLAGHDHDGVPTTKLFGREAKCILSASSHLFVGFAMQAVISMSQVASSGHLGREELAAIGLAHMVVVLTGYPVTFSVLNCLETFASQAYMSAQPRLVGAYFMRALQIQWLLGLVMGSIWAFSGPLLSYIVRDTSANIIALAVTYLRWYFVPYMVFSNAKCATQVLYAQGITYPMPYLMLLGTLVSLGAQYTLTFAPWFKLGVRGIALGTGAGELAMLLATLWVIHRHDGARIWTLRGGAAPWRPFMRLFPSCLLLTVLSTSTSELVTMAATQLGSIALSTQSVLSALGRMNMILLSSIGIAALNRQGNHIGQQSVRSARVSTYAALCIGLAATLIGAAAIVLRAEMWVRIFTSDELIVAEVLKVLPVAVGAFAAQALVFVGSQLFSAQGRQALSARIKIVALYMIGVPLGYYWMVVCDHGLAGVWRAVAVGQLCTLVLEVVILLRTNWLRLIDRCSSSIIYAAV